MRLMAGTGGRHWPIVVAGVGVTVLAAAAAWLSVVWVWEGSAEVADQQASVFGAVLASALAAAGLVGWAWRRRWQSALPATAEQLDHALSTLSGALREQWQAEAPDSGGGASERRPPDVVLTEPTAPAGPAVSARSASNMPAQDRRAGEIVGSARKRAGFARERAESVITDRLGQHAVAVGRREVAPRNVVA